MVCMVVIYLLLIRFASYAQSSTVRDTHPIVRSSIGTVRVAGVRAASFGSRHTAL
ncbi:hypothetical protein KC19_VG099300 [Ceratodon purpureus]|uniref:Secreted protein n=1 Tax=Ceratodon purpureus TaxID=3225 RepID=A0A8T0HNV9_CERPU|nr:hypothetical protein KC19_VG099300 [Ceratodon purpureus]